MQSAALTEAAVPHLYLPLCARSCLQVFAGAVLSEPHFPPPPPAACPGQGLGPPPPPFLRLPASRPPPRWDGCNAHTRGLGRARTVGRARAWDRGRGRALGGCGYARGLSVGVGMHGWLCALARSQALTRVPVRAYTRARACLCTHTHLHGHVLRHTRLRTRADRHTPVRAHTCVHTHALPDTRAHTPTARHRLHVCSSKTRVCARIYALLPVGCNRGATHMHPLDKSTRMHTHTCMRAHMHTHMRAHPDPANRNTHPHACTCTAPQIQTRSRPPPSTLAPHPRRRGFPSSSGSRFAQRGTLWPFQLLPAPGLAPWVGMSQGCRCILGSAGDGTQTSPTQPVGPILPSIGRSQRP